jgi:hypothetical protein
MEADVIPAWPQRIVAWLAPAHYAEALLGDLEEEFHQRAAQDPAAARRWYRRQAWASCRSLAAAGLRRLFGEQTAAGALSVVAPVVTLHTLDDLVRANVPLRDGRIPVTPFLLATLVVGLGFAAATAWAQRREKRSMPARGLVLAATIHVSMLGSAALFPAWYYASWWLGLLAVGLIQRTWSTGGAR